MSKIQINIKKSENISKFNEIMKFFNGLDNLIECEYQKIQKSLDNTLENLNSLMHKPNYIKIIE